MKNYLNLFFFQPRLSTVILCNQSILVLDQDMKTLLKSTDLYFKMNLDSSVENEL